jgi:hypothetical protein
MYNQEHVAFIADDFIKVMETCINNKEIYKNNKDEMLNIIRREHPIFFSAHYRLCKSAVETDVGPLIEQMKLFYKVQTKKIDFNRASHINDESVNGVYFDPVLNSEKLKNERKMKDENKK